MANEAKRRKREFDSLYLRRSEPVEHVHDEFETLSNETHRCSCVGCPFKPRVDLEKFCRDMFTLQKRQEQRMNEFMAAFSNYMAKESGVSMSDGLHLVPEPMTSREQVEELEEKLADSNNEEALVSFLSTLGGRSAKTLASNVMARLMDLTASRHYNIRGSDAKQSFKGYRLYKVVIDATKRRYADADVDDIHAVILEYLRSSVTKLNKRIKRAEVKAAKEAKQLVKPEPSSSTPSQDALSEGSV